MKTAVIAITERGAETALGIATGTGAELHLRKGCLGGKALTGLVDKAVVFESLSAHTGEIFDGYEGLIFVMSLGIVNRVIAPLIKSKHTDPAVVTLDETGRFVISTLSGHEGGANRLAYRVSSVTGAEPVVTTATEANRTCTCGVGCRKGISAEAVMNAVDKACSTAGISTKELRCLASAWLKSEEPGLIEAAERLGLHIRFIPRWMIKAYYASRPAGGSPFVHSTTGVPGVAEPCAMLAGSNTELLLGKTSLDGVTVAIARERLFGNQVRGGLTPAVGQPPGAERVLVLGGTTEASEVARKLAAEGRDFFLTTATEYGQDLFTERFGDRVIRERFTEDGLLRFVKERGIGTVIDCTHPYAEVITAVAKKVCEATGIEYVSKIRDTAGSTERAGYDRILVVPSLRAAAEGIVELGMERPLFTTGSKDLSFVEALRGREVLVRVLPSEESLRACLSAGIRRQNIIAMQGPFTAALNTALIREYAVDCLVTKETGTEGGFDEKIEAARKCGIWVIVVRGQRNDQGGE